MNLYIQTSLYQDNKYVPHLLEHCVLFSQERSDFFTYYNGVEGTTFYGYTDLEFTAPLTVDEVLHKITQPISLATFSFQKRVIADELKNATYSQKLREKFYQVLANTPQIVANKVQKGISLELLNAYQKEWYQEQHMLLIKDDEQIDFTFGKGKILKPLIGKWNKKQIALKHLTYQKEKYELLFCEYRNASDILVLDFFEGLLTSYLLWKTTQEKKYFIDTIRLTLSDRFFFLSLEELPSVSTVDEDFFTFYKNYYLTGLAFNHWRGFVPIIALFTGEYVDVPQHQAFIKQLTYQDMQYILSLVLA